MFLNKDRKESKAYVCFISLEANALPLELKVPSFLSLYKVYQNICGVALKYYVAFTVAAPLEVELVGRSNITQVRLFDGGRGRWELHDSGFQSVVTQKDL